MIWNLLEKQQFSQKACLTISSELPLEQKEYLAISSEQG